PVGARRVVQRRDRRPWRPGRRRRSGLEYRDAPRRPVARGVAVSWTAMRMRPVLACGACWLVRAGCAPTPEGPAAPLAQEQFGGVPALYASAARQTVVD